MTDETPPAGDAKPAPANPTTPAAPAADAKSPSELLHDAAVAFIIAGRLAAVDLYGYLGAKIDGVPGDEGTDLANAATNFIAAGETMEVDLYEYLKAKVEEIAD